jgi:hypothetical protein
MFTRRTQKATNLVPMFLVVRELDPLRSSNGMLGDDHIAGKSKDTFVGCVNGLIVELHVPNTRGTVLEITSSWGFDKMLLTGCVSAKQSNQAVDIDDFSLENGDEWLELDLYHRSLVC